jgi:N-acetylmuramoyl-L-alanine amidase
VKVCIDPGHGGSDPGAVGPSGSTEKARVLSISLKLSNLLENSGYEVSMTRDTDKDVAYPGASLGEELQARCNVANEFEADLFVSIHANAATSPTAHGTETFFHPSSEAGQELADAIHDEMTKIGFTDRGTKTMTFYVLAHTNMPAVLVETAFISNKDEEAFLASGEGQDRTAQAIAKGIDQYVNH